MIHQFLPRVLAYFCEVGVYGVRAVAVEGVAFCEQHGHEHSAVEEKFVLVEDFGDISLPLLDGSENRLQSIFIDLLLSKRPALADLLGQCHSLVHILHEDLGL
jgi:hypothetical protein